MSVFLCYFSLRVFSFCFLSVPVSLLVSLISLVSFLVRLYHSSASQSTSVSVIFGRFYSVSSTIWVFLCLSVCPPLCPIAYLHLIVGFLGYMWSYSSFAHLRESCSFHVCLTDMKWMHAAERRTHICLYLCLSACLFLSLSLRNKPFYPSVHPNFDLDAVAICKDI